MRETSRSLDAMYYDYDAIIIIIFITIHTTTKVKYTDIRNFIDSVYFSVSSPRNVDVFPWSETDDSPSVVGGDVIASFGSSDKPLLLIRTLLINPVANAISVFIVLRDAYRDCELSTRTRWEFVALPEHTRSNFSPHSPA